MKIKELIKILSKMHPENDASSAFDSVWGSNKDDGSGWIQIAGKEIKISPH